MNFILPCSKIIKRLPLSPIDPEENNMPCACPFKTWYILYTDELYPRITRRWELYDGPCPSLSRGEQLLILAFFDYQ